MNATPANALDIDDNTGTKASRTGRILAVWAISENEGLSGTEFLTALLIGYEIGIRAGIIAHQLRPEYHCTGSWGAVGAAAGGARASGLDSFRLVNALGIAEYFAPYSPMMRCIAVPSMVKDGIGWGSMAGVSAVCLAETGYTGIPPSVDSEEAVEVIRDLGVRCRIKELYFKPFACCRWVHPALEGVKEILEAHAISHREIDRVIVHTFREAAALSRKPPRCTEEAQYNLAFPIAAFLVFGRVGPVEVLERLEDPEVCRLMDRMVVQVDDELAEAFPEKALSRVEIIARDGTVYRSSTAQAAGDFDRPLSPEEKRNKFLELTAPQLGDAKSEALLEMIQHLEHVDNIRELSAILSSG